MKIVTDTARYLRALKLRLIDGARPRYKLRLLDRILPPVRVRAFKETDLDVCCEIYKLNEPDRFPDGYFDLFREALTSADNLFLVVECDNKPVAFGGISLTVVENNKVASLSYGMIHPEHQRKGIGTVLLLARIATLPESRIPYVLTVSPLETSRSFFTQFGFAFANRFRDKRTSKEFELLAARVTEEDWVDSRHLLSNASVKFEVEKEVPNIPFEIAGDHYVVV